jgi:malonate-semialdehyde dehydrogenase (acetylating)/methylmalonate-semialdehyde dehydrogenase
MPDADLDLAVDALMGAVYGAAGERCIAPWADHVIAC